MRHLICWGPNTGGGGKIIIPIDFFRHIAGAAIVSRLLRYRMSHFQNNSAGRLEFLVDVQKPCSTRNFDMGLEQTVQIMGTCIVQLKSMQAAPRKPARKSFTTEAMMVSEARLGFQLGILAFNRNY